MLETIRKIFFKHLDERNKTYWSHAAWAAWAGLLLIYAGIVSIIHAVVPPLFAGTSERIVRDLASRVTK